MMDKFDMTFRVSPNDALLMQAFYAMITAPCNTPEEAAGALENNICFEDYFPWLVDEVTAGAAAWRLLVNDNEAAKHRLVNILLQEQ
jgi:hypothetical protein